MRPIFDLSRFSPSRELVLEHTRVALLVGLARTVVLLLVPMITMRLFIEERRSRTVEMLFTSPIHDHEIVLGKWFGGMLLYMLILTVFVIELGIFQWPDLGYRTLLKTQAALISQGAGLLAIGEWVSTFTRHEVVAAAGTFLVCMAVLRYYNSATMNQRGYVVCGALLILGWVLTWRSIRVFRGTF